MPGFKGGVQEVPQALGELKDEIISETPPAQQQQPAPQPNPQAAAQQQIQSANMQRDTAQKRANIIQFIERVKQGEQNFNQQKILKQQKDQEREAREREKMNSKVRQFEVVEGGRGKGSAAASMERGKTENKARKAA